MLYRTRRQVRIEEAIKEAESILNKALREAFAALIPEIKRELDQKQIPEDEQARFIAKIRKKAKEATMELYEKNLDEIHNEIQNEKHRAKKRRPS